LNSFIDWIRNNTQAVTVIFIVLFFISIGLGFTLGLVKRRKEASSPEFTVTIPQEAEKNPSPFILPPPIVPGVLNKSSSFSFYFEENLSSIDQMELLPFEIPDLLENSDTGNRSDVKIFRFQDQEFDILMRKDDLAEP
jgi:hypothetical protein